jgi:hypothetical protein
MKCNINMISLRKLKEQAQDQQELRSCILIACGSFSPITNLHLRILGLE